MKTLVSELLTSLQELVDKKFCVCKWNKSFIMFSRRDFGIYRLELYNLHENNGDRSIDFSVAKLAKRSNE